MYGTKIGNNILCCKGKIICGIKQELIHLCSVLILKIFLLTSWIIFVNFYLTEKGLSYLGYIRK
jgi:hypothetical protein